MASQTSLTNDSKLNSKQFISLPHHQDSWKEIKSCLTSLRDKQLTDISELILVYNKIGCTLDPHHNRVYLKNIKDLLINPVQPFANFFAILPFISDLSLRSESLFPNNIPKLLQGTSGTVSFTREQASSILALAFFDTLPCQGFDGQILSLLETLDTKFFRSQISKLQSIISYFNRLLESEQKGDNQFMKRVISFERRFLLAADTPDFAQANDYLIPFKTFDDGSIEDDHGCLQVDFANKYIGGGVLSMGNVQEEIRFSICPECLVSILICDSMLPNEAIVITG